jgi:uncharacterized protein
MLRGLCIDGAGAGLRIRLATTWWTRAVGLLATAGLDDPCGLWIEPCNAVHTLGMRYPIDLAYLDRRGRVLRLVTGLSPLRWSRCPGARVTLELRAGLVADLGLRPGQLVTLASEPH